MYYCYFHKLSWFWNEFTRSGEKINGIEDFKRNGKCQSSILRIEVKAEVEVTNIEF